MEGFEVERIDSCHPAEYGFPIEWHIAASVDVVV